MKKMVMVIVWQQIGCQCTQRSEYINFSTKGQIKKKTFCPSKLTMYTYVHVATLYIACFSKLKQEFVTASHWSVCFL